MRSLKADRDRDLVFSGRPAFALDVTSDRLRDPLVDAENEAELLRISFCRVRDVRDRERMRLSKVPRRSKELRSPAASENPRSVTERGEKA